MYNEIIEFDETRIGFIKLKREHQNTVQDSSVDKTSVNKVSFILKMFHFIITKSK